MYLSIIQFLIIPFIIYLLGILGLVLNRNNVISMLISIELLLIAINIIFIISSIFLDDIFGQMFALMVLTVAAAESAIGLAIVVAFYRIKGSINVETIRLLKN
jgi:NADH-quinone oxidoreductase subunit K